MKDNYSQARNVIATHQSKPNNKQATALIEPRLDRRSGLVRHVAEPLHIYYDAVDFLEQ